VTLIAEVRVAHPDLFLSDALEALDGATFDVEYQTMGSPDERLVFVRVSGAAHDAVLAALERDHTVADPRLVAMFADHAIFRVRTTTDLEIVPREATALGARVLMVRGDGDGWRVRLHLLTRDAFDAYRAYCQAAEIAYQVRELSHVDDVREEYAFGLTERQRTTLLLAHDAGYYRIPRNISQDELAAELGVSKSAVSQRLRRAVAVLIENTLVTGDY